MFRHQLQHVILEIGERFGVKDFYVIGSAAILAVMSDPPIGALTATRDVDVIPTDGDERLADRISFVIGEASEFDAAHGYYAQGVSLNTPRYAPRDWPTRAIPIRVGDITAWCMEPTDLVLSKLGVGREKDLEFARSAAQLALVTEDELLNRLSSVPSTAKDIALIADRIRSIVRP